MKENVVKVEVRVGGEKVAGTVEAEREEGSGVAATGE